LTQQYTNAPGVEELSPNLKKLGRQIAEMADDISGKTIMGNKGKSIQSDLTKNHDQCIKQLAQNDKASDERSAKLFWNKVSVSISDVLKKNNFTHYQLLASMGRSSVSLSKPLSDVSNIKNEKAKNPLVPPFKKEIKAMTVESNKEIMETVKNPDTEKKYILKDISTNKTDSIFETISERYQKSALPRLAD